MSVQETNLKAIADAIREKDGTTAAIPAHDFPDRIRAIQSGGIQLESISITTPPSKTAYTQGEQFDPAGMMVRASYTNGATRNVTGYAITPDRALTVSDTTVTVSFTEEGVTKTAAQTIGVQLPSVAVPTLSGLLTYTGAAQSPVWSGYDSTKMTIGGTTSATNAGTYSATFTLMPGWQWSDGTTAPKSVFWSIAKAAGSLSLSASAVTLNASNLTAAVTVTRAGDGAITATSSDTSVAAVSVSGNVVTISSVGQKTGAATVTIKVAAGANHNAPADKTVAVTAQFNQIFGVCWQFNNSSPALQRLTVANDPNHLVTTDITSEPVPAVGTDAGSSPFDNYYPWNKMEEWNVVNGTITVKRGQPGFSRTANDTVVFIPEFYFKVVNDAANSKRYFYVSQEAAQGFAKHPGSGRCVGKYSTGAGYVSKSGLLPLTNISMITARTGHKNLGAKFNNYDFTSWGAIQLLYIIEFANWDSQAKIGKGYVTKADIALTGGCDSMNYHTGRAAGVDGATTIMYRWIENLWGNIFYKCDGINMYNRTVYICTNPVNFDSNTQTNYISSGITAPNNGYISQFGYSEQFTWAFIPSAASGSPTTYITDNMKCNDSWRILNIGSGGGSGLEQYAGLFGFFADEISTSTYKGTGARQLYLPTETEIEMMAA